MNVLVILRRIEDSLIFGLALGGLVCAAYAMMSRYIAPQIAFDWVDELMTYCLVWSIWLASARVLVEADHVRSDMISMVLPSRWAIRLGRFTAIVSAIFCTIVAFGGAQVVLLSLSLKETSESGLAMPLWIYSFGMPLGLSLLALRFFYIGIAHHSVLESKKTAKSSKDKESSR